MRHNETDKPIDEWAKLNLCEAALWLRMSRSGATDPMSDEDEAIVRRALIERVNNWRPTRLPRAERADNAVREFVRAALEETTP